MGLFDKMLDKLGFGGSRAAAPPPPPVARTSAPPAASPTATTVAPPPAPAAPPTKYVVDVPAKLDLLVSMGKEKLDWRHSIVDLLKALSLDSSLTARKAMAAELGCPPDKMADSAQMNMWLHKAVMKKLADNGGNIPPELLD